MKKIVLNVAAFGLVAALVAVAVTPVGCDLLAGEGEGEGE